MRPAKLATLALLVVLVLPATAHARTQVPRGGGGKDFHDRGDRVHTRGSGVCWEWTDTFTVKNTVGQTMYAFGEDLVWCANADRTKVTKMASNGCWDAGGHWEYHPPCDKWNSAGGGTQMHVVDQWSYSFDLKYTTLHRHPYVDAYVYPDARISGTAYSG